MTRLKIDRSFIQGICTSPEDAAIVRAILHVGRSFGLAVIAEDVETEEQCERSRKKGCKEVQGFLFGKPLPAMECEKKFTIVDGVLRSVHGNEGTVLGPSGLVL